MFGKPFYLAHLGRTPVYVSPDAIFMVLLVYMWTQGAGLIGFLISLMMLFLAIVFHEGGHAMVARSQGMVGMHIVISAFGGYCSYGGDRRPKSELLISLAGVTVNGLLAWGAWLIGRHAPIPHPVAMQMLDAFFIWNISLAIFNILPIYPQDGGQALLNLCRMGMAEGSSKRLTLSVSVATAAVGLALYTMYLGTPTLWLLFIIGMLLFAAFRDLR